MDKQSVLKLISEIAPTQIVLEHKKWVTTNCLLAPWTHASGKDSLPSFGISHSDKGEKSHFNCFSCKNSGSIDHLLSLLEEYSGVDFGYLKEDIETTELLGSDIPPTLGAVKELRRKRKLKVVKTEDGEEEFKYTDYYYRLFPLALSHPYLKNRGVDNEVVRELELRVDPGEDTGIERILFPIRGVDGTLQGMVGRDTTGRSAIKVKDYEGFKKEKNLLGIEKAALDRSRRVYVVEGPFDYVKLYRNGYCAVAALHSNLTEDQVLLLAQLGKQVVLAFDNDKAGKEGMKAAFTKRLVRKVWPIMRVSYPRGLKRYKDPDSVPDEELHLLLNNMLLC